MSALCIISLDDAKREFTDFDNLAKQLVLSGIRNDFALHFNYCNGIEDKISKANIKNFISVSESFVYNNCDELFDLTKFAYYETISKEEFALQFKFLSIIVDIIFSFGFEKIDIYLSEDGLDCFDTYNKIETKADSFFEAFYFGFLQYADKTGFTMPDLHLIINKN